MHSRWKKGIGSTVIGGALLGLWVGVASSNGQVAQTETRLRADGQRDLVAIDRQAEILGDKVITFDEYEQVIGDAIACGRDLGLEIDDPIRSLDGVTLEFVLQHSSAESAESEWALFEGLCYLPLAQKVDVLYQTSSEVETARVKSRSVTESCGLPAVEEVRSSKAFDLDLSLVRECVGERTIQEISVEIKN